MRRRVRPWRATTTAAVLAAATPAAAQSGERATDRIVRDCAANGRLDRTHPLDALRRAVRRLPVDVEEYTDCGEVIRAEVRRRRVRLRFRGAPSRVRAGVTKVRVQCRRDAGGRCRGFVGLRARRRVVARARFTTRADGRTRVVRLRLRPSARRALAGRSRLRVLVMAGARVEHRGALTRTERAATLRR